MKTEDDESLMFENCGVVTVTDAMSKMVTRLLWAKNNTICSLPRISIYDCYRLFGNVRKDFVYCHILAFEDERMNLERLYRS